MITTERELAQAINQYALLHGRFSANDLERDVTPLMADELRGAFNHAARLDRYRIMLKRPKEHGLNIYISIGEDEYAHQNVLTFDEWFALAEQTAASGRRAVAKLRRIAEVCQRLTGRQIDVDALIRSIVS